MFILIVSTFNPYPANV